MEPRTLAELRQMTRERLDDTGANRPRYSDAMINRAIAEAEVEACVRAHLLCDETTDSVALLAVTADQPTYVLHPSVYRVDQVRDLLTGERLREVIEEELERRDRRWRLRTGLPREYLIGALPSERLTLTLVPNPYEAATLRLRVYRLPRYRMETDGDEPEIAARHHDRLVDWAVYRCMSVRDPDLYDPVKADAALAAFVESFGERDDANVQRKKREQPGNTVRPARTF